MDPDPLVSDYLARLDAATTGLPPDQRSELRTEIRAHIEDALREAGRADEASVRDVLDRLGHPEEIAAAAGGPAPRGAGVSEPARTGAPDPARAGAPEPARNGAAVAGRSAGAAPETNGLAIASLLLGLLGFFWAGSVIAIPVGYWARRQIRKARGAQRGAGLATAGIVLGWVGVAMLASVLVGSLTA